jgi:hypothetical protein
MRASNIIGRRAELPALDHVFRIGLDGMHDTAEKTPKFMKSIPAKPPTVLVFHARNIQAITGAKLSSGEMAVEHLDATGGVTVDGGIMVPWAA